jgi:hypothetical protein
LNETNANVLESLDPVQQEPIALLQDFNEKTHLKNSPKTVKLADLLKVEKKKIEVYEIQGDDVKKDNKLFTEEEFKDAWSAFAESRKVQRGDYQLLNQQFEIQENRVVVFLSNPIQEAMLNEFKTELNTFLRERLHNNSIQVTGELRMEADKKIIYTNRDKYDFLVAKNPLIKELKDKLGLDTDF